MLTKMRGGYLIRLYDRDMKIRYTINELVKFEEITGKKLTALDNTEMGFTEIRALVYVGLIGAKNKNITLDNVGEELTKYFNNINSIVETCVKALTVCLTGKESIDKDEEASEGNEDSRPNEAASTSANCNDEPVRSESTP